MNETAAAAVKAAARKTTPPPPLHENVSSDTLCEEFCKSGETQLVWQQAESHSSSGNSANSPKGISPLKSGKQQHGCSGGCRKEQAGNRQEGASSGSSQPQQASGDAFGCCRFEEWQLQSRLLRFLLAGQSHIHLQARKSDGVIDRALFNSSTNCSKIHTCACLFESTEAK